MVPLEGSDGVTELEHGGLLKDRGDRRCVHRVLAGKSDHVVGHDVPERVASTLVVLGNLEDGLHVGALEVHGLGVSAPHGGLHHVRVEHVYFELVDDGLCDGCGGRGETSGILHSGLSPAGRNLDDQPLAAKDSAHFGVVVLVDLDDVLDPLRDLVGVGHYLCVDLLAFDVPASYLTGLETLLNSGQVNGYGPLG